VKIIKHIAIILISLIFTFLVYDKIDLPKAFRPFAFFAFGVGISFVLTLVFFRKEINCYKKLPKKPSQEDIKNFFECLNS